jgi:hypothetical protein
MVTKLDNNWVYRPDENLGKLIVENSPEKAKIYENSKLCARCRLLKVWSQNCRFSNNLASLSQKIDSCDLCRLLAHAIVKRAARWDETITFVRSGMFLSVGAVHENPILSLCTTSGTSTAVIFGGKYYQTVRFQGCARM